MSKTVLLIDSMEKIDDAYVTEYFATKQKAAKRWLTPRRAHMLAACLCVMLVAGNLLSYLTTFKRISYNQQTMGENLKQYINEDTQVTGIFMEEFPQRIPIYKISKRTIHNSELQQMKQNLGIPDSATIELKGNRLIGMITQFPDSSRGYFNMTDEELEKAAWEVFEKLPFMEGTYEYLGIRATYTISDSEGTHIARAGVFFRRVLDDMRVVGNDICNLYFDGSGFVEFNIELYSYEKIGMMDVVPFSDACGQIKKPDRFTVSNGGLGVAETLQVDRVKLLLVNQYHRGCKILQPVYNFIGTATDSEGKTAEFESTVIAIPEKYTHD